MKFERRNVEAIASLVCGDLGSSDPVIHNLPLPDDALPKTAGWDTSVSTDTESPF
jgi:hypothetical protein